MENRSRGVPHFLWWIVWLAILCGPVVMFVVWRSQSEPGAKTLGGFAWFALLPLLFSSGLRWLLLPRQQIAIKAYVIFVMGLATAESCSLLGIFLGGEHRFDLFVLGLLGVLQWMPLFARRFYAPDPGNAHGLRSH